MSAIAYVVGFFVLLLADGWHPHAPHKAQLAAPVSLGALNLTPSPAPKGIGTMLTHRRALFPYWRVTPSEKAGMRVKGQHRQQSRR